MMVAIGNFVFHYRNGLFPLIYGLALFKSHPLFGDFRLAALIGFVVALTGQLLRAITIGLEYIKRGGRNRQVYADNLVQGGVFAHCRNPLYLGNFVIIVGIGIVANSRLFLAIGVPLFALAYAAIIAAEENYLRAKFGEEFQQYCARVNRLIPNFSGFGQTFSGMHFNWRRLITAEYGSTFIWTAAIPLLTLRNIWWEGQYDIRKPLVWSLWSCFGFATLAYATARFLKKSGALTEKRHQPD